MNIEENLNIVLFEPEIPQNTGNIGRTCVLTNSKLHLIKPLGFDIDSKAVQRAGLDYWKEVDLTVWDSFWDLKKANPNSNFFFCTTKGHNHYDEVKYRKGDFLVFGRESSGLPDEVRDTDPDRCIRVPMVKTTLRSLNISNTAAVIAYEALRQIGFENMK